MFIADLIERKIGTPLSTNEIKKVLYDEYTRLVFFWWLQFKDIFFFIAFSTSILILENHDICQVFRYIEEVEDYERTNV